MVFAFGRNFSKKLIEKSSSIVQAIEKISEFLFINFKLWKTAQLEEKYKLS